MNKNKFNPKIVPERLSFTRPVMAFKIKASFKSRNKLKYRTINRERLGKTAKNLKLPKIVASIIWQDKIIPTSLSHLTI